MHFKEKIKPCIFIAIWWGSSAVFSLTNKLVLRSESPSTKCTVMLTTSLQMWFCGVLEALFSFTTLQENDIFITLTTVNVALLTIAMFGLNNVILQHGSISFVQVIKSTELIVLLFIQWVRFRMFPGKIREFLYLLMPGHHCLPFM